jgi:ABC-2 type transport system permease protein
MTSVHGMGQLVRLQIRRDRLRMPLWILAIAGLMITSASSVASLYPDQESVEEYVTLFGDNPALVAFAGPGHGFDDPNVGVVLVNEAQLFCCVAMALMSIFLVNRHTRAEEDTERAELVRSSVVGRHAPLAAATLVVGGLNVVIAAICAVAVVALDYPVVGSLALAGSLAGSGIVFAGITAVSAQASSSGRAALGLGGAALGAAFVLRAVGDIGENAFVWLSPIGWAQAVKAYAGEAWWTLALCTAVGIALVVVAFWLSTQRDIGSGLLPQRLGNPSAAGWLRSPLGLAMRLQRGSLIGWTFGLFVIGIVYGSIGEDIEQLLEDNAAMADFFAQLGGATITDSFFATAMTMLAIGASGFAISSVLRINTEESSGRLEPLLASPIPRWRFAAGHVAVSVAGTAVAITTAGAGVGISYAVIAEDAGQIPRLAGAGLVTVPGVLVLSGVAVALVGVLPRFSSAAWAGLAVAAVVGFFGDILRLPDWARWVSPLEHTPALPAADLDLVAVLLLSLGAGLLTAAGLWSFHRRDMRTA